MYFNDKFVVRKVHTFQVVIFSAKCGFGFNNPEINKEREKSKLPQIFATEKYNLTAFT